MGFRIHTTTFDGRDRPLGLLIAVLVGLALVLTDSFVDAHRRPSAQARLIDAADARSNPDRIALLHRELNDLDQAVPEDRNQVAEMVLEGWSLHCELPDRMYPTVREFIRGVKETIQGGFIQADTKTTILILGRESPAQRLARSHEGRLEGPFRSQAAFERVLGAIAKRTKAPLKEMLPPLEEAHRALKLLGQEVSMLKMVEKLAQKCERGGDWRAHLAEVRSEASSYPERFREGAAR